MQSYRKMQLLNPDNSISDLTIEAQSVSPDTVNAKATGLKPGAYTHSLASAGARRAHHSGRSSVHSDRVLKRDAWFNY